MKEQVDLQKMKINIICLVLFAQLLCIKAEVGAECSSTQPCSGNLEVCSGNPGKCKCSDAAVAIDKTCYAYATEAENHCQFDEQCQKLKDDSGPLLKKYTKCDKDAQTCVCHGEHWFLKQSKCNRGLGASCTALDTCAVDNSACSSPVAGTCACKSGFKQEGDNKCVAKPECEVNADCMNNAECVGQKCQCKQGFVEVTQLFKKVCLPYSSPENGYACSADAQCSLIKDESNPEGEPATCGLLSRICGCNDGNWYPNQEEGDAKFPICVRGFGSHCTTDAQCQKGITDGACVEGECACSDDYVSVEEEHMCLPYATEENNKCVIDEQCSQMHDSTGPFLNKHPKCDNDTESCVCHEDHYAIFNNSCVRGLGAKCNYLWKKCGIPHARCGLLSHTCDCKFGYVPNEDANTCDEKPECVTNDDCPTNGQCVDKKCECNEGFVQAKFLLQTKCLPYATSENHFSCMTNSQCSLIQDESGEEPGTATCGLLSFQCECEEDTWFPTYDNQKKTGKCMRGFGSNCTTDAQCGKSIPNSVCTENSCECPEDHATLEDQKLCLPFATVKHNKCEYEEQCQLFKENNGPMMPKYPTCNTDSKTCTCRDEHSSLENGECIRGLGASCGPMRPCGLEHSSCSLTFKCVCDSGYVQEEGSDICTPRHECEATEDCQENAECVNNVCKCSEGFVEHHGVVKKTCLPYATVENQYACQHDDQCSLISDGSAEDGSMATCGTLSKKCSCKDSAWFINNDKCVRGFGASCDTKEDCSSSVKNSICEENVCKCLSTHATIEDKNLCLPFATMQNNKCEYEVQCQLFKENNGPMMPKYPTCNTDLKSCTCRDEHSSLENGECIRGLGASCGPMRPCGLNHSTCSLTFKCECESGYVQEEGSDVCTAKHQCEVNEDCQENSSCVKNICQCNQGFVEHQGVLKTSCLPYATADSDYSCQHDDQCSLISDESSKDGAMATCGTLSKKCSCKDSAWFISKEKCVRGFGASCTNNKDCSNSLKNSVCEENTCRCPQTHATIQDKHICLPYATIENNICQYDEQCGLMKDSSANIFNQNPICNSENKACQCHEENWTLQGNECVRGLGAHCSAVKPCGLEHSVCSSKFRGICQCEEGFQQQESSDVCTEIKA